MFETYAFPLFIIIVIIFLGGFAVGTQWNVSQGERMVKWFRDGFPLIGERSTKRWLGSSVVELKIQKAKDPFRTAETLVMLEPRDVPLLWAWTHSRGRRDLLMFRAQLRGVPAFELEAFDPNAWMADRIKRDVTQKNWARLELGSARLQVYSSGGAAAVIAKQLIELAERAGGKMVRLSIHRTVPNLEVHWVLPDSKASSSRDWFANLRQIAETILHA